MAVRNPLWTSRLVDAEAHLEKILLFLKKQSEYALSRADLKHLKIEVHDFDLKDGTTHTKSPIRSYFQPRSNLRPGLVELMRYNETYERWIKNSHSLLLRYPLLNEVLLKRILNRAVDSLRECERFLPQTAEELETEWESIQSYGGSYRSTNVNISFNILKALTATKHHHCHRLVYMLSDGPERKNLHAQLEPPEVKHIREVNVPESKKKYMRQCAESFKGSGTARKNLRNALNSCGVYQLQPERKQSPSTAELIVLISWMLGSMREQKKILSSRKRRAISPNLVFPIQVVSFKPRARVRVLNAYYDGVLHVGMSDTQRLGNRSSTNLRYLFQWLWPSAIESTTKLVVPLGSISEEDEDECCDQETRRARESITKECMWKKGLDKLSGSL